MKEIMVDGERFVRAADVGTDQHSFQIGEQYLIRTVTFYYTGRLVRITASDIVLEDAAWIADTARFGTALITGKLNEVEPYPDPVAVPRGAIVDFTKWRNPLPRNQT